MSRNPDIWKELNTKYLSGCRKEIYLDLDGRILRWTLDRLGYARVNYIYLTHGRGKRWNLIIMVFLVLNRLRNISLSFVRSCQLANRCEIRGPWNNVAEDSSILWCWPWRLRHWIFRNVRNISLKCSIILQKVWILE